MHTHYASHHSLILTLTTIQAISPCGDQLGCSLLLAISPRPVRQDFTSPSHAHRKTCGRSLGWRHAQQPSLQVCCMSSPPIWIASSLCAVLRARVRVNAGTSGGGGGGVHQHWCSSSRAHDPRPCCLRGVPHQHRPPTIHRRLTCHCCRHGAAATGGPPVCIYCRSGVLQFVSECI